MQEGIAEVLNCFVCFDVYQASITAFFDCVVFDMEAMTPEQLQLPIIDENFLELADLI